ncbi:hypothetical protein [Spiroplasma sp. DGKH1]|uniref:hypothetical protein n=1 Tax=Spiroplasma sp. DGKH1 TaxID=3050074 RepID=UPI0034C610B0
MYNNNRSNNNFQRRNDDIISNVQFPIIGDKGTNFKTVNSKDGGSHDLFEFWVEDNGNEVHCIAWDDVANKLKSEFNFDNFKNIIITYKKRLNKFTEKTDYSVREFSLVA